MCQRSKIRGCQKVHNKTHTVIRTMKLTRRFLFSPLWLGCLASNNSLTVSAFRPNRPLAILEHRNRHDVVMDIPRGGGVLGLPVTKENLVAFWIVYNLATGSLLPAPEKIPEQYSHKPLPVMPPGGFLEFVYENVASSCLGTALMLYLSVFKSTTSVPETIAYGSMPCYYVFWKALLKNNDLGTPKGFKALNVAIFLGFYYAVFGGYGNPELLAKIFGFMVTAMGVVGSINPALVTKSAFGADLGSGESVVCT